LGKELGLEVIPEVARQLCHQMGYQSPTDIPDQQTFRTTVLDGQIREESSRDQFVADRCTIDAWVMWQRWQLCSAMTYDTEAYYEKCRKQAEGYDSVIYIPPLFDPPEDAFRWTDKDYVTQVDRLTRMTLYDWSLWDRTYTIHSAQPDERLQEAVQWLRQRHFS
jgi:hypothetical protein